MYILGVHAGHDASACLLKDGRLVFASEEERYSKVKHHVGYPNEAIKSALAYEGIRLEDIEYFALSPPIFLGAKDILKLSFESLMVFKNLLSTYNFKDAFFFLNANLKYRKNVVKDIGNNEYIFDKKKCFSVDHHLAHVTSSCLCSDFKKCVFASWDCSGVSVSTLLGYAKDDLIIPKYKTILPNSLGFLYADITRFLGFRPFSDEGKVMGLAPYGAKKYNFDKLITLNGYDLKINPSYLSLSKFIQGFTQGGHTEKLQQFLGDPFKNPTFTERSANIAHSLQYKVEEICLKIVEKLTNEFDSKNLCIAGGVGLNSKLNGEILASGFVKNIFIQPLANDAGLSLGAALELYRRLGYKRNFSMKHVYYGPEFNAEDIERVVRESKFVCEEHSDIYGVVSELLTKGCIIGWFQGRMELGSRALGNRCILADPREKKIKDKVNRLKGREHWRPLAASFLIEEVGGYVESYYPSPFMILVFKIKEEKINEIPAVVHVDNTCRLQTVEKDVNPRYWRLINEFKKETGIPCVLNTSMNVAGMPICCTPEDALLTLEMMGLDYMAIGDFLVKRGKKGIKYYTT